jgi:small-conductance mechanosensitive channel
MFHKAPGLTFLVVLFMGFALLAFPAPTTAEEKAAPPVSIAGDMSGSMKQGAVKVGQELTTQAKTLFEHTPLGWNINTLEYAYLQAISLPGKIPELIANILEQSRILGFVGSIILLIFLTAVIYSLIGRKRALLKAEEIARPVFEKLPKEFYPYLQLLLRSVTAALIPLVLLGVFSLVRGLIAYHAPWFLLVGNLLLLWSVGALLMSLLRGVFDQNILKVGADEGKLIVRGLSLVIMYILIGIAVLWGAEAFGLRPDFLALLRFVISVSIVVVLFLFFLRKKAVLSLLPQFPYSSYQKFLAGIKRYYYPVIFLTFLTGLLWCIGYRRFCTVIWTKTWAIAGVYVGFTLIYYVLIKRLKNWSEALDAGDEEARVFIHSLNSLILYVTIIVTMLIMTNLLGLLDPIQRVMSFPLLTIGASSLSLWIMVKAVLIIIVFFYVAQLVAAYLDYKIYPSIKVDPGPAYAIDTFLKYFLLIIGVVTALQIVGFDLRALLVFAGAIGIGVGLAMQNLAANLISGFAIIFGGKIRKGDWLEVGGTLGFVTDIYLRATRVRTRDNIEHIIPNTQLMSNTIINYSLSSPMIRIDVPFGVSYSADPNEVSRIALETAAKEPMASGYKKPEIRFVGYGESSIDFELLVWIDVRKTARRLIKSRLYFAMFDALKQAGIEIPFPQRDIHIRSSVQASAPMEAVAKDPHA